MPFQYLIYSKRSRIPLELKVQLATLDQHASLMLKRSKQYGKTYIVTNAAEGWVEISAKRFLPRVFKELQHDVVIISARTKYEKLYPKNY